MSKQSNNRSGYIIGLILIGIGLLFLLNTLGIATFQVWYFLFKFWPVILILVGLNIILKKTALWWIVPILIFVIFIGAVVMPDSFLRRIDSPRLYFDFGEKEYSGSYQEDREFDSNIEKLDVEFKYGANRLNVSKINNEDYLYDIGLDYRGESPKVYYNRDNSRAELSIEQAKKVNIGTDGSETWNVNLTDKVPIDINVSAGAGDLWMDLEELKVSNLNIDAGLGQIRIRYPDYDNETKISAGAGNIKLIVPSQTALRIETSTVINNNNFEESGLIQLYEDVYQSKNYGEAENRIKIKISTSAGNINIEYN
ncbi:MAG TPA: LiaF domain-containing protein [Halanaerobiales bacterium]|nr:LiaF domain-containing protein [Halanaerobiales bacterium]